MPRAQSQAERAFDQVVEWLEHFEPLDDPRQSGKVLYRLDEVLLSRFSKARATLLDGSALMGEKSLERLREHR